MKKPGKPSAKKGAKGDAPFRIADPASGRQLRRGSPVANAGASKGPDYSRMKTVQPVARVGKADVTGAMGGPRGIIEKSDVGRVKDPASGVPLRKGNPVDTAYSGSLNQRVDQGLESAVGALSRGLDKGAPPSAGKGDPRGGVKAKKKKR